MALASVAAAWLVTLVAEPVLGSSWLFLFLLAVLASASYGGLGPGILAALLSVPVDRVLVQSLESGAEPGRVPIFLMAAGVASLMSRQLQGAREAAETRAAEADALSARLEAEAAERARLFEAEHAERVRAEAAERRLAFLGRASVELARSVRDASTAEVLCGLAVPAMGDWCVVRLVWDGDVRVRGVHVDPAQSARVGGAARILAGADDAPLPDALRTGAGVLVPEARRPARLEAEAEALWPRAWVSVPIPVDGQVAGSLGIACVSGAGFDTRDLEIAEELARRAGTALENARLFQASLGADRAKADFLAVMSHELRTPLTAVIGYADLLHEGVAGPTTERQRQHLARIRAGAWHLVALVDEVLAYARLEAGLAETRVVPVSLLELVHEAAESAGAAAAEKRLRLVVDARDARIATDADKLRQILGALLSNAVKFTERGDVLLEAAHADGWLVIRVRDTGPGIEERDHERIFHPFTQLESANTRHAGGAGLGLTVARRLVQLLGGELTVDSAPGRGSTFTVRLPVRSLEPED